jgi:hypothetical protein
MKPTLTAASLALALSTNLLATQATAVALMGGSTCAEWAEDRRIASSLSRRSEAWLRGLLNGFAFAADKEFWDSGDGLTNDQVFFWMDRYCDENPLKRVVHGAITLMNERTGTRW